MDGTGLRPIGKKLFLIPIPLQMTSATAIRQAVLYTTIIMYPSKITTYHLTQRSKHGKNKYVRSCTNYKRIYR